MIQAAVFQGFRDKIAISAELMAGFLRGRAAQGMAVGGLARGAEALAARGAAVTPGLRQAALGAVGEARAGQKAVQATQGLKTPFLGRMQQAEALGPRQFNTRRVLAKADTVGAHPYSRKALDTLTQGAPPVYFGPGVAKPTGAAGAVTHVSPAHAPTQLVSNKTQLGQIGGRGIGMAYEPTQIAFAAPSASSQAGTVNRKIRPQVGAAVAP